MKMSAEKSSPVHERLFALDFLRGLDMALLTVLGPLVWAVHAAWGLPEEVLFQFTHPWEGFTLWDIVMPGFLFMCGAAIPLSLGRRLEKNGGRPDAAYWKHVFGRVAMLWVLGMVVQGHLLDFDPLEIRPYNNTLQTIAAGYLAMAALSCVRSRFVRLAVPVLGFAVYACLLHFLGDYSMTGNFAEVCEQRVLGALMPEGSKAIREIGPLGYLPDISVQGEIHYTWWLTTPMFVFMTACGDFSARLVSAPGDGRKKALTLAAAGAGLLAVGWLLSACGVKVVKHVFTASFTAQAMGWCMLALAAAYVVTDVLRIRRGLGVFTLFGRTSLLAYMIGEWLWPCFVFTGNHVTRGLVRHVGAEIQGFFACLAAIGLLVFCLYVRRLAAATKKEN